MNRLTTTLLPVLEGSAWAGAAVAGRRPRIGPLHAGVGAGRFQHSEWSALLSRFVQPTGVDYANLKRVQRLVEEYLKRLAETDPETFIDADDQLAFYLNAYNAIAIHQVLRHYPLASVREIPDAFLRPYPIGPRNVSLHTLHANILRSFGDPRIHAALSPAALGGPQPQPVAFAGVGLQAALDAALRRLLADPRHGVRFDEAANTLYLPASLRWFAGDFADPAAMPGIRHLIRPALQPTICLGALHPCFPADLAEIVQRRDPHVRFLPFDWRLNAAIPIASGRTITAL